MQGYTGAVRWFAAGYLLRQAGKTSWEQVSGQDIEQWMAQLLDRYSSAYASIQFRALRQFFKWLAAEDIREKRVLVRRRLPGRPARKDQLGAGRRPGYPAVDDLSAGPVQRRVRQYPVPGAATVLQVAGREEEAPDPMARLRAPKVTVTAIPVFTSVELSELDKACQGRSFAARRDAAIIAIFTATGIRLSELAGIRYHPGDPARSDLDLHARQIRIRGKGGTARTVKIGHQAARSLDRYLRARARHPQA